MTQEEKKYNDVLEYWKNRKPFKNEDDIPPIPIVKSKDYENIIIPNIIRCGGIQKDKLEIGKTYVGNCRNASKAVWLGNEFEYMRYKFGYTYPEKINHFQDDDGYDVFVPLKEIEDIKNHMKENKGITQEEKIYKDHEKE